MGRDTSSVGPPGDGALLKRFAQTHSAFHKIPKLLDIETRLNTGECLNNEVWRKMPNGMQRSRNIVLQNEMEEAARLEAARV